MLLLRPRARLSRCRTSSRQQQAWQMRFRWPPHTYCESIATSEGRAAGANFEQRSGEAASTKLRGSLADDAAEGPGEISVGRKVQVMTFAFCTRPSTQHVTMPLARTARTTSVVCWTKGERWQSTCTFDSA